MARPRPASGLPLCSLCCEGRGTGGGGSPPPPGRHSLPWRPRAQLPGSSLPYYALLSLWRLTSGFAAPYYALLTFWVAFGLDEGRLKRVPPHGNLPAPPPRPVTPLKLLLVPLGCVLDALELFFDEHAPVHHLVMEPKVTPDRGRPPGGQTRSESPDPSGPCRAPWGGGVQGVVHVASVILSVWCV